jgi:hypothetical protein
MSISWDCDQSDSNTHQLYTSNVHWYHCYWLKTPNGNTIIIFSLWFYMSTADFSMFWFLTLEQLSFPKAIYTARWISVTDFFRSNLHSLLLFARATDCCRTNGRVPPREWRKFYKRGPSEVQFVLYYYLTEHCNILTEQIDQVCPFGYNESYIS